MGKDLLILAVVVIADAMTLVHNQQRKFAAELIQITRHRLHATKHHFAVALFTLQTGGKDIRLKAEGQVLGMVLRHQLFHMRQHQHAPARQPGQFGDHQALASPGREHNGRRFFMLAKVGEGRVNRFLLIGAKSKCHGISVWLSRI